MNKGIESSSLYPLFSELTRLETELWDALDSTLRKEHGLPMSRFEPMAVVDRPCALHIWGHSRMAALQRVMACAISMVVLHGLLLADRKTGGHIHAGVPSSNVAGVSSAGGLLMVIALEIATALLAATLVARLRSVPTQSR